MRLTILVVSFVAFSVSSRRARRRSSSSQHGDVVPLKTFGNLLLSSHDPLFAWHICDSRLNCRAGRQAVSRSDILMGGGYRPPPTKKSSGADKTQMPKKQKKRFNWRSPQEDAPTKKTKSKPVREKSVDPENFEIMGTDFWKQPVRNLGKLTRSKPSSSAESSADEPSSIQQDSSGKESNDLGEFGISGADFWQKPEQEVERSAEPKPRSSTKSSGNLGKQAPVLDKSGSFEDDEDAGLQNAGDFGIMGADFWKKQSNIGGSAARLDEVVFARPSAEKAAKKKMDLAREKTFAQKAGDKPKKPSRAGSTPEDEAAAYELERELDLFGPDYWKQVRREKLGKERAFRVEDAANAEDFEIYGDSDSYNNMWKQFTSTFEDEEKVEDQLDNMPTWGAQVRSGQSATFFAKAMSFVKIGASEEMQAALESMGIERPSRVQATGYAKIRRGDDIVLADQTGSGKTIAYLTPIVDVLRATELAKGLTPAGHVRALVLTPTAELAQQVLKVARAIAAGGMPFRSRIITGEAKWHNQAISCGNGAELLICTPGRLKSHLQAEPPSFSLSMVSHVVLDEADILFEDRTFDSVWKLLRKQLPATASTSLVTATLPDWLIEQAQLDLPLAKILKGKNLHRTSVGVTEKLIDCSSGVPTSRRKDDDDDGGFQLKADALFRELDEHPASRILIFCNTIESCRRVENAFRRRDKKEYFFKVEAFHGAIPMDKRRSILEDFLSVPGSPDEPQQVLICTDRASRGIDFREVRHVVLFDFPRDGIEYVRRVGRATRGTGVPGHVTSLVLGRQIKHAKEIMRRNYKGDAIALEFGGGKEFKKQQKKMKSSRSKISQRR